MILWHPEMRIDQAKISYIHRELREILKQSEEVSLIDWKMGF